jgi:hypothetical protein
MGNAVTVIEYPARWWMRYVSRPPIYVLPPPCEKKYKLALDLEDDSCPQRKFCLDTSIATWSWNGVINSVHVPYFSALVQEQIANILTSAQAEHSIAVTSRISSVVGYTNDKYAIPVFRTRINDTTKTNQVKLILVVLID